MTVVDGSYSPRLRTGVVFCGVGTAGAYHAGVLKALTEAGVKIDLLAGHGVGVMTALCGAIDGGAKLWDAGGPWTGSTLGRAYRWRTGLRVGGLGLLAAAAILLSPLLVMVFAAVMYAASLLCALVNLPDAAAWLVDRYRSSIEHLFAPPWIPTIVPRAPRTASARPARRAPRARARAGLAERSRRRLRGAIWWRLVGAPLDAAEPAGTMLETLWRLVRGASNAPRPAPAEIGRRYAEVLADNLGQPGFRELLVAVHDVDARRDLVGALLRGGERTAFEARHVIPGPRGAETVDLAGPGRDLIVDFLLGALQLPVVSAPHVVTFPAESYWRGEAHRVCDRPELTLRLLEEVAAVGVEQVILVSAAAPAAAPHGMRTRPLDLRGRMGEVVRSIETAALRDAWAMAAARFAGVFAIRPDHNPVGPFDFAPTHDEASDRRRPIDELVAQGYREAYRQFIEPVVATGDKD